MYIFFLKSQSLRKSTKIKPSWEITPSNFVHVNYMLKYNGLIKKQKLVLIVLIFKKNTHQSFLDQSVNLQNDKAAILWSLIMSSIASIPECCIK